MATDVLVLENETDVFNIFGNLDENIKLLEKEYNVTVVCRGQEVKITGESEDTSRCRRALLSLKKLSDKNQTITEQNVRYAISMVGENREEEITELTDDCICVSAKGRPIRPKTVGQKKYIDAIRKNTIVLGVGPAGTGKTYLAVSMAVTALRNKDISKIILTRPAVEAGEKLGFLPGDLQQKIDPYLRPLYDALYDMLGFETYAKYAEKGIIEIAPLAYMRGRTLDDSFIILDEAQNATREQMKMFLTRLGFNSKAVITGDITQVDLPYGKESGLIDAVNVLKNIEGIGIQQFTHKDVVRNPIVQKIINAYEKREGQVRAREVRREQKFRTRTERK